MNTGDTFALIAEETTPPCIPSQGSLLRGPLTEVWSCGGGTQSVAIAALIVQGRLPAPDLSVIVDTEREKDSTWQYMDAVLVPELARVGVTLHRVRKSDYAKEDVWDLQDKHLLLPVFTAQTEEGGKHSSYCSDKWKRRVSDRWLRAQGVKHARKWIGYSVDEARRWLKVEDNPFVRLPLVKDVPLRRQQCKELVLAMGWPEPPRSACWMCPNQSDEEWLETRDNRPEEFAAAVQMEREFREKDPLAFLHEQRVPLDQVDWTRQQDFVRACDSGACFR